MSYNYYYARKNCCVESKCPVVCPTGPTGRIGPVGPAGPSPYDSNGNLDVSCNLIIDVSGIYFCDGTYIGHGNSFDISTNELLHLKSSKDIIIAPSNTFAVKGNLDMCGNNIIDISLNLNTESKNQFVRYNTSNKQICYKSIDYSSFSCNISQDLTPNIVKDLSYNTIDISNNNRIYYTSEQPSHIKFSQAGIYKIGTSVQFANLTGPSSGANVYLWFKNLSGNIKNSSSLINLDGNNAKSFNYVELIYPVTDYINDYIEISAVTSVSGLSVYAVADNGVHPAVPSIITTVIQIA